jgi:hypothetical protein
LDAMTLPILQNYHRATAGWCRFIVLYHFPALDSFVIYNCYCT